MSENLPTQRPPLVVRLSARWAVTSLVIAVAALAFANIVSAGMAVRVGLEIVFWGASTVGVTALLLWVVLSGVHLVFGKREEDSPGPGDQLW